MAIQIDINAFHPCLRLPTVYEAKARGRQWWAAYMTERAQLIAKERDDPFRCRYEPPVWKLCDALIGWPWIDPVWADRIRRKLGFAKRVEVLGIMGGNRGGKSEYCITRSLRLMAHKANAVVWPFHSSNQNSIEQHQQKFWLHLPREWRRKMRSENEYVSWTKKYGFSASRFVLPNGSECTFRNYEQELGKVEGGEVDLWWLDELAGVELLETLELRLATREGYGLVSFTPVRGVTPTVQYLMTGAEPVLETTAYLLPKDELGPDVPSALGFPGPDYAALGFPGPKALRYAYGDDTTTPKVLPLGPRSYPEDMVKRVESTGGISAPGALGAEMPQVPSARRFESVHRVLKCFGGSRAVVYFHSSDNPYGNPLAVWRKLDGKNKNFIKERFYGLAFGAQGAMFTKFNTKVHVIPAASIPAHGTNYMIMDPAFKRNCFMLWVRVCPGNIHYVYREWPGPYEIPGVGIPGEWALPSGQKSQRDGKPGPAQTTFGWGLKRYLREIARLEGWRIKDGKGIEDLPNWDPQDSVDKILTRLIDSRAASSPRLENDRPVTLYDDFCRLGLPFRLSPGKGIDEAVAFVQEALDYDPDRPLDPLNNQPHLFISDACPNLKFSLQTWTSADGDKGACLDPLACLFYHFTNKHRYHAPESWQPDPGMAW